MNLKLLKKFTELANHNSNEHEANSAARRVCKMLEESNYKLVPNQRPIDEIINDYHNVKNQWNNPPPRQSQYQPPKYEADWYDEVDPHKGMSEFKCVKCGRMEWTTLKYRETFLCVICYLDKVKK